MQSEQEPGQIRPVQVCHSIDQRCREREVQHESGRVEHAEPDHGTEVPDPQKPDIEQQMGLLQPVKAFLEGAEEHEDDPDQP